MSKKVYLVGAGPGDIELLTLKGMKLLNRADVVLYDALVNPEIFQFCKDDVIKVNVGKRKDHHLKKQEEINELIVEYAQKHETVVRLKGGTPFVFGRGYEEVRFIVKAGFEPVVVSGVSSTTSVLESFMIPSIDREFSDAYRTITGHDMKSFSEIVTQYHSRENLVIMMGIHNLKQIVFTLLEKGYPSTLPIAILSKGTCKDAQQVVSTLGEIEQKDSLFFEQMKQLTPAIIFVGQTLNATQELIAK
ncbi:uroporphyrinogen-III C-methyltransferase [Candidatus Marinarcus aquaticus]|uniref:uroporphyrinogen-III C-methyltransferase n=1 Tax=Candidatus Marinarcus aquaticus TaxID=2044504 RepID=A0A4Q0XQL5_9BACT|nr:uroporphyrinogen-III C-methyltransferase [Candidatus Marinarcus aquaticus]RXJ54092.1 uroporphyrinogen-III C-methyltransferase [Candidatus Marinarcus aquaticus]